MSDIRQSQTLLALPGSLWIQVRDGDPDARKMYERHYSHRTYADGRRPKKCVGPGEYLLLATADRKALFAWRKFISMDHQEGVNCTIFRNEGDVLSSELILDAERWAWRKWPGSRLYTYVNPRKVRSSHPGYCFLMAGWNYCGASKGGLVILEKMP